MTFAIPTVYSVPFFFLKQLDVLHIFKYGLKEVCTYA